MTLMERISQDMKAAMKAREAQRLGALRMAKAALMNKEVEKGRALDSGEEQQVIDLADQATPGFDRAVQEGRPRRPRGQGGGRDRVARRLPPATGGPGGDRPGGRRSHCRNRATSAKDLGKVMKAVMPRLAGRAVDGRTINDVVRKKLGA